MAAGAVAFIPIPLGGEQKWNNTFSSHRQNWQIPAGRITCNGGLVATIALSNRELRSRQSKLTIHQINAIIWIFIFARTLTVADRSYANFEFGRKLRTNGRDKMCLIIITFAWHTHVYNRHGLICSQKSGSVVLCEHFILYVYFRAVAAAYQAANAPARRIYPPDWWPLRDERANYGIGMQ